MQVARSELRGLVAGPDCLASDGDALPARNAGIMVSAVGVERCRDAEGGVTLILGNRAGQSSAYRLPEQVASDLENLLGSMRAFANDASAGRPVTRITDASRPAVGMEHPPRLSLRACITIVVAASVVAWAGIACAASLLF